MAKTRKIYSTTLFMAFISLFFAFSPLFTYSVSAQELSAEDQKKAKEAEEEKERQADLKGDIKDVESDLDKEQKKLDSLQAQLQSITSSLNSTQSQIAQIQKLIQETEANIKGKEETIRVLEGQLDLNREVLSGLVQQLYYSKNLPLVEVLLSGSDIQAAWNTNDHLFSTQEKIQALLGQMHENRERISQEKSSLENAQEDREMLLAAKNAQKQTLAANQADVADDVEDQEATVDELQEKLREMQSDLTVITGKSFNAKDIREAVEFASKQTGVPKGVLYGFLKMETNLGANTGQCTYDQVKKDALSRYYNKNKKKYKNSIALLEKRYNLFVTLTKKLDYSKNKKVSCTPSGYVGQGGAMGVPQFMSDTWQGYASQVASKTGHATPDPWDLGDGVMAMALKLRAAGATSDSPAAIKKASINYLGTYYANYYNGIVYWSKNYKKLFD